MTRIYKTVQGDTFDKIAKEQLGDEHYLGVLVQANFAHRKTVIFSSNIQLVIPDIDVKNTKTLENIAPWKRPNM